jgi:hypothetical protein
MVLYIGIVVQLVRAPPCHGGSCGFEPRQSRIEFFYEKINDNIFLYLGIFKTFKKKQV